MNKALLLSIVSVIGVIVFSMAAAVMIAPELSSGSPASLDKLLVPGVLVFVGLIFAVAFTYNFRAYRDGR